MRDIDQIRNIAQRRYATMLKSWPDTGEPFPVQIPLGKIQGEIAVINRWVESLKKHSLDGANGGYDIRWKTVNLRDYGNNSVPTHVVFNSEKSLAQFLGNEKEWQDYSQFLAAVSVEFPQLASELPKRSSLVIAASHESESILKSLKWMVAHPLPGCYLREIPDLPHSKFIEDYTAIFRYAMDCLLSEKSINQNEDGFERRFGYRKREHFFICRALSKDLKTELRWPSEELAFHPESLASLDVSGVKRVIIVENQVNLHTLPSMPGTLAIHGHGFAVSRLSEVLWLQSSDVAYWGDLDVQGFEILALLRRFLPRVKSLWMNGDAVRANRKFVSSGKRSSNSLPTALSASERCAYRWCRRYNARIEQERIPQEIVTSRLLTFDF